MRSGTLWIALWLGMIIGGVPSSAAAQLSPAAQAEQRAAIARRAALMQQRAQGQPAAQPSTPSADMSITAASSANGMPAVGELVTYTLAIANAGPSDGNRGRVTLTLNTANISIESVSGSCDALPCYVSTIPPGKNRNIFVNLRILSEGAFGFTAQVRGVEYDPYPTNNSVVVSVSPPLPTPTPTPTLTPTPTPTPTPLPTPTLTPDSSTTPLPVATPTTDCFDCQPPAPWWRAWLNPWTFAGVLLVGLGIIGAAILRELRHQAQRRWLRQLQVTAEAGFMAGAAGPISLEAPALTLSVRCEPGEASVTGTVPINKVDYHD